MTAISEELEILIVKALQEADDALGALRRGYGADVSAHCYPARNTVAEALELYHVWKAREGRSTLDEIRSDSKPHNLWGDSWMPTADGCHVFKVIQDNRSDLVTIDVHYSGEPFFAFSRASSFGPYVRPLKD